MKIICNKCGHYFKGRREILCLKCKLKIMDELKPEPTEEEVEDAKDIVEELGEELDEEEEL